MRTVFATGLLALTLVCGFTHPAAAIDCSGGTDTCRTVVDSIDTLESGNYSDPKYKKISIACYHDPSLARCAGGGDFDYRNSGQSCLSSPPDGATIIRDNAPSSSGGPNCFGRRNFGLNGVVDARQCGVIGDGLPANGVTGHPDDAAVLNTCIGIAFAAGYRIVSTGGGVILDNTGDIGVMGDMWLTCGGTSVTAADNNDYRIAALSKAIVLDPTNTNATGKPLTVRLTGNNPAFSDCTVEAGTGTGATLPNPYSPSVWYPNCDPVAGCGTVLDKASLRSSVLEASAFNPNPTAQYNGSTACGATAPYHCGPASQSAAVTVDGAGHASVHDIAVLGFGTCVLLGDPNGLNGPSSAPGAIVEQVLGDCNRGVEVTASNAPSLSETRIDPLLTGANFVARNITAIAPDPGGSPQYQVTSQIPSPDDGFRFMNGDTVWIGTGQGGGRESARGRWTVGNYSTGPCTGGMCEFFLLEGSASAPFTVTGNVSNGFNNGTPPTAITGLLLTGPNLRYLAPGQGVVDSAGCITAASSTKVTAVWPAQGIAYISKPPACPSGSAMGDTLTITDNGLNSAACNPANDVVNGSCAILDAGFRFGDGFDFHNTGGLACYNCRSGEHMVSFHMNTGSNNAHLVNSVTALNVSLPDQNLAPMNLHGGSSCDAGIPDDDYDRQNIVSLLIDGAHCSSKPAPPPSETADACDVEAVDSILGQHRPVAIVIDSTCNNQDRMTNIGLGVTNGQNNAIGFELDNGVLALSNTGGSGANDFVSDKGTLAISNVRLDSQALHVQSSTAGGQISGCGNVFNAPTPYLCAPSSFTQLPGGRLTLQPCDSGGCHPVMNADTTSTIVYYAPYVSQQVPLYNTAAGTFGLSDAGASGLALQLEPGVQTASQIYDIFAGPQNGGVIQLCSGPAWSSSAAGSSSRAIQVTQISGVWVNAAQMQCHFYPAGGAPDDQPCAPYECTYLGSIYTTTAGGQVSQQFSPPAANGGGNPCLCLYNAYNRVVVTSRSLDNTGYSYNGTTWRFMHANANNRVTVVDGVGQMQILAQVTDALANGATPGRTAQVGIDFNVSSSIPAPVPTVQANSATSGTYSTGAPHTPYLGLWYAQAVEAAPSSGNAANFGGSNLQQLSVQVAD